MLKEDILNSDCHFPLLAESELSELPKEPKILRQPTLKSEYRNYLQKKYAKVTNEMEAILDDEPLYRSFDSEIRCFMWASIVSKIEKIPLEH